MACVRADLDTYKTKNYILQRNLYIKDTIGPAFVIYVLQRNLYIKDTIGPALVIYVLQRNLYIKDNLGPAFFEFGEPLHFKQNSHLWQGDVISDQSVVGC